MKILVTGAGGMVGNAIKTVAREYPDFTVIGVDRADGNLTKQDDVKRIFENWEPDYVIHTAAMVGGIGKNLARQAELYYNNILMNTFVVDEAYKHGVKKLIAFSSICAFPQDLEIVKEEYLHDGKAYFAHWAYSYAKRMIDVQIESYKKQYGVNYCSLIPVNIFGEHDNYDIVGGHVLPSLIHKCYLAKKDGTPFEVWGNGTAQREFIYSKDLAHICYELLNLDTMPQKMIASGQEEIPIKTVVDKICDIFDYHNVKWLTDKPNGQLRRPTDNSLLRMTLPKLEFTPFDTALKSSVQWFLDNYPDVRGKL
jgi:GDP-L-fucose synthase